jgi:hypothetical protein
MKTKERKPPQPAPRRDLAGVLASIALRIAATGAATGTTTTKGK